MISISSEQNEHYKRWRSLADSRGIRKAGEFILMGEKLIQEYLNARDQHEDRGFELLAEIGAEGYFPRTRNRMDRTKHMVCSLPVKLFDQLDVLGTKAPMLVLRLPEIPAFEAGAKPQGLELVCPIGDPGNLGAVVRAAAAFGVSRMILTNESSLPFHPKALKASAGSALGMSFVRAGSLKEWSCTEGEWALDMEGTSLEEFKAPKNLRLILGEEGPGLPGNLRCPRLSIPMQAGVESLNVAVAAGITLYRLSHSSPA